jgi:hypothetical protein
MNMQSRWLDALLLFRKRVKLLVRWYIHDTCACSLLHPVHFKGARAFGKIARDIVPGVYAYVASG